MPIYEYQCKKCKHKFEKIQKFSDPPVKKCPDCGGPVERLLSAPAVQFKGSGWYVTDYARKGASGDSGGSESSSDSSKSSESSDSKKSDSKSESKSESKAESKSSSKSRKEK